MLYASAGGGTVTVAQAGVIPNDSRVPSSTRRRGGKTFMTTPIQVWVAPERGSGLYGRPESGRCFREFSTFTAQRYTAHIRAQGPTGYNTDRAFVRGTTLNAP